MSDESRVVPEDLLELIVSALEDLTSGRLDRDLLPLDSTASPREQALHGVLSELIVSRRRAAQKLVHIAAAIESTVSEVRDRVVVTSTANADVTASARACEVSATELSGTARKVTGQAIQLHALIESVAEATSNLAESGQQVTRDGERVSTAVSDVATSATAIASSLKEIDRAMSGLAKELASTSGAVTNINSSIRRIDAGASETSALSDQMSEAAAAGIDVVRQTADAVEAINTAIGGLGRSMERLEARSEEVSEITKIIQAIAVQLKLLALNASIQAAHAGEAGRGFAVVAREIKQLSDSTTASTREIETVIRTIRGEISVAAEEARASGNQAQTGMQLAHSASVALDAIFAEAELIRSRVQQISDATSAQATETANLMRAIGRVTELAERLRRTSNERNAASQKVVGRVREISSLATRLRTAMSDQEQASLGIVAFIEKLISVAGTLETAASQQSSATEELASAVSHIYEAGRASHASVAAMAYANGLLEQNVLALRAQVQDVQLPRPVRGGKITVPTNLESDCSLDPVFGYSELHSQVIDCIFETLVANREGGRIVPMLADRWDVSADGLIWTFYLRPDVKFHNGRVLTADDVKFSFDRLANLAVDGAFVLASVKGIDDVTSGKTPHLAGVSVVAPLAVRIELSEPVAFFLGLLSLTYASITPKDIVEADHERFQREPIGTGPFRFVSRDHESLKLQRFEEYRNPDCPYVDELFFTTGIGAEEALEGTQSGRFSYTNFIPRDRLVSVIDEPTNRSRVLSIMQPHCQFLLMNGMAGHLEDRKIRQAISYAIDRRRLVELYGGFRLAEVAKGLVPPHCPGYEPTEYCPDYDPDRARNLVESSGFDASQTIKLFRSERQWSFGEPAFNLLVENLSAVGLKAEIVLSPELNSVRKSGNFDILEAGWYGDYLDPDSFTFGAFHSKMGSFSGLFDAPELDQLFETARSTPDPIARAELYRTIQQLFFNVCPAVAVLHRREFIVHGHGVEGIDLYPLLPTVRPRDIWLKTAGEG